MFPTYRTLVRRLALPLLVGLAVWALVIVGATHALAGGSDGSAPYTVDRHGITLPAGEVFPAHGHVNVRWTNPAGSAGLHFDPNNNHPGGKWIGKSFIPWSALGVPKTACITWVQIHGYNAHFGEGGQDPVCLSKKPKPSPSPKPTPDPSPSPEPEPEPTPDPSPSTPSPDPSPTPTPDPPTEPSPEPSPSPEPTPTPEPTQEPSPEPEPEPTPGPTPSPEPSEPPAPECPGTPEECDAGDRCATVVDCSEDDPAPGPTPEDPAPTEAPEPDETPEPEPDEDPAPGDDVAPPGEDELAATGSAVDVVVWALVVLGLLGTGAALVEHSRRRRNGLR